MNVADGTADVLVQEGRRRYGGPYVRYELRLQSGQGRSVLLLGHQASIDHFEAGGRYRVYYMEHRPLPIVFSAERTA